MPAAYRLTCLLAVAAVALPFSASATSAAEVLPPGAASCQSCHTPNRDGGITDLSSLSAAEIVAAMNDYRAGRREGTMMPRLVRGFSEAETRAIAAALGRKP